MAYKVSAEDVPQVGAMGREELRPRTDKDGNPKLSPSGEPTFASGVVALREDGGADLGVSVAVIELPQAPWPALTRLKAAGDCWLVPYVTREGRLGLSFTVERLVPVSSAPSLPTRVHKSENN